ncbi:TonB-dependent receptor [Sphaerotilus montanus]|uniref:Iron complex outermembrane receptor protein n=1 Tax=Sphaerotilus montanus TaxID=522889 RepID=A0A7Y9QXD4_9BURK|nr:TonB-dependent receptor [Sphaerotilus montanus]NYG31734.1 iron complex outermembrane receptor protein [Sphaerotilus montanus]NZD56460.1 TonB-dependent receptor [Sphaerotilus montanus]
MPFKIKAKTLPLAISAALATLGQTASASDATTHLGEVLIRVSPGPVPTTRILTSVDILGGEKVEDKHVMTSWELLGQMPGIQLTETRMGAESGKATFRAFNGEGYINGIKTLIDGIPSNVNSGNQRFIDMVFPLEVERIEVVRGTNDPRHGLHNIGGNLNFVTRRGGNYSDGRVTYGSFDTREVQVAIGREADGFAQNYFAAWQASDGHRDHAASKKFSLGGKWFHTSEDSRLRAGLTARVYQHEAEEAGYLTAAEVAASRTQSPSKNAHDGDERDMQQFAAHLDWKVQDDLTLSSRLYHNRYTDDRRITFTSYATGNAPRQRRLWDETQTGLTSTLTWRASADLTVDGGLNIERQHNAYIRHRFNYSDPTDFSVTPARVQNDDAYTFNNIGAYVQAIVQVNDALKVIPAFRMDKFSGDTRLNTTGVSAPLQRYGWIHQPKLSAVYSVTPDTQLYANWGKTIQVLTGSREPAYLTSGQANYGASLNTGQEIGVKFRPAPDTEARIAAWQQDATDEVANMPSTGTTVGLGQTRRKGLDVQVNSQLDRQWSVTFSHALQQAKVVSAYTASGASLAGKEVFSTPRHITNLGVDFQATPDWRLGVQARSQGSYFIDDLNAKGKHGGFAVLDASVRHQLTKTVSIDFQVRNLTNRAYAYVWYDNFFWGGADQPMYSPAPGRSAYLSLNVKL